MISSTQIPEISVLTTCYNRAPFIAQTIESVLAQSFKSFEYIIVDDCSTDDSFEIAQSYAEQDERIQVYRNDNNLGDYPNRNRAASYARGRYLKYIDSDDILYPHALEICVRYMDQYPTAGLGLTKIHSQEKPLPELLQPRESFEKHYLGSSLFGNAPGSVVIRRDTFDKLGAFSGKRLIGDLEMWLKIASHSPILLLPGFIHWDRHHPGQQSACDDISYATLRHNVAMRALEQDTCPLDQSQQTDARRELQYRAALFAIYVGLRRLSPLKAIQFVKSTKCGVQDLLKAACDTTPGVRRLKKKRPSFHF
ncbi:MAG: glycosyltransferase family 2 protein [Planctomycetota bacterium]|nr:glycosyltransferase family 2 protein [Planctomycetota bacterium]